MRKMLVEDCNGRRGRVALASPAANMRKILVEDCNPTRCDGRCGAHSLANMRKILEYDYKPSYLVEYKLICVVYSSKIIAQARQIVATLRTVAEVERTLPQPFVTFRWAAAAGTADRRKGR